MSDYEVIEMPSLRGREGGDDDYNTNVTLSSRKQSWSKRQLNKVSILFDPKSTTEELPRLTFRKSEIQRWKSRCQPGQTKEGVASDIVECLKVTNPSALDRINHLSTRNIKSLIIEDSEGTLTELPLNQGLLYSMLVFFKLNWSCVKSVPHSLLHPGLKVLDLEENHIHSIDGIQSARSLEKLILKNNHLLALPEGVGTLNHLKEFDVSKNKIKELPNSLGSLNNLEFLDVSQNKIKCLPDAIGSLKKLKFFNLTQNLLTNFPTTMSQLTNLEDLQASSNQLTSLSYSFESLISMQSLLLSRNKFKNLPSCLSSLPRLEKLSMNANKLQFVSESLSSVKLLNIDNNQFTDIPKSIIDSPKLEHLWMRGNQLTSVPDEISKMQNLQSLHISNNPQLKKLPSSMTEMPSLRHLFLQQTLINKSDEVIQELALNTSIHLDGEIFGMQEELRKDYLGTVTPEMLMKGRFCSLHSNRNCSCVSGKLGLISKPQSMVSVASTETLYDDNL